jgi:hypothetical protein
MSIRESRVSRRKGWKRSALALAAPLVAVMSVGAVASSLTNASAAVAMPDLVVTSIAKPTATAGGQVQFSATVKNQGTAATPAGVIIGVQFQVDAKSAFTWSDTDKTSLAAGASVTLTANGGQSGATWTATAGTHTVRALVDDINRIAEANETNNAYTLTYTTSVAAPPPPDDGAADGSSDGAAGVVEGCVVRFEWSAVSVDRSGFVEERGGQDRGVGDEVGSG